MTVLQTGYSDLVRRLYVARQTGHASPELIDSVLAALADPFPAADRRLHLHATLRQAADLLGGDLLPWPRAGRLAAAIARWSGRPEASEVSRLLHEARATGLKIPRSQRRINDLLSASTEMNR